MAQLPRTNMRPFIPSEASKRGIFGPGYGCFYFHCPAAILEDSSVPLASLRQGDPHRYDTPRKQKCLAERFRAVLSVAIMSIGPFRSTLEPFREFILSKRRARLTWEEIAQAIREQGVACTRQAVQGYYKRQKNMRVPMGFESARPTLESTNRPNLKQAAAEPRQIKKEKGVEWPSKEEANQIIQ